MGEPALRATGLRKSYGAVLALDGVDLSVMPGGTVAVVGESGSGKSTLARCLAGIEAPDAGEVVRAAPVQLVFQDAAATLNPRFTAEEIVREPLDIQRRGKRLERRQKALEWMERAGIARQAARRRPHQFSGGQRQRLAIARALTLEPRVLILDEALSGLDLGLQAQILNLLADLQRDCGLAYVLITHDMAVAGHMADEIVVMYRGQVVERGSPGELRAAARHPHTRALLEAAPV